METVKLPTSARPLATVALWCAICLLAAGAIFFQLAVRGGVAALAN